MPSRRTFLKQTVALALGSIPLKAAITGPSKDWFLLESGCLQCAGVRRGKQWKLTFTVWLDAGGRMGAL